MIEQQPYPTQTPELQRPDPPTAVLTAVKVMYAGAAASVLHAVVYAVTQGAQKAAIERKYPHLSAGTVSTVTHISVIGGVIVCLLGAVLFAWIARACRRGRNWARVTGTALFVLGFLAVAYDLASRLSATANIVTVLVDLIGLAAVVLLWQRRSSAWFASFKRPQF
jgi:hypothetical protein